MFDEVLKKYEDLNSDYKYFLKSQKELKQEKEARQENLKHITQASKFFTLVSMEIHKELKQIFENLGTMGLQTVFNRAYEVQLDQEIKRKQPEIKILTTKNGTDFDDPLEDGGHGCVDTLGVVLRIILHSIDSKQTQPFFLLDEPGRNVSVGFKEAFSELLKKLSEDLGIQFIVITHDQSLTKKADRKFLLYFDKGTSTILEAENDN